MATKRGASKGRGPRPTKSRPRTGPRNGTGPRARTGSCPYVNSVRKK